VSKSARIVLPENDWITRPSFGFLSKGASRSSAGPAVDLVWLPSLRRA